MPRLAVPCVTLYVPTYCLLGTVHSPSTLFNRIHYYTTLAKVDFSSKLIGFSSQKSVSLITTVGMLQLVILYTYCEAPVCPSNRVSMPISGFRLTLHSWLHSHLR
ncbi:hypothetical protein B0T13DRAFT_234278 [Neurospora crassa]|nr:hypothetical protein B0T13DRAFT_234278 [Neurospora crassa]